MGDAGIALYLHYEVVPMGAASFVYCISSKLKRQLYARDIFYAAMEHNCSFRNPSCGVCLRLLDTTSTLRCFAMDMQCRFHFHTHSQIEEYPYRVFL